MNKNMTAKVKRKKRKRDYVGRIARLPMDNLVIEVAVVSQGWAFGHDLVEVEPVRGEGRQRVRVDSLSFA